MPMFWILNLIKSLFSNKPNAPVNETPLTDEDLKPAENIDTTSSEELEVIHDEPADEFDDPKYDVENETDDDHTPRTALPDPDREDIEELELKMSPLDIWKKRQGWLRDAGFDPGVIDGKPGRKTNAAVVAFQKSAGLTDDGIWGPKTEKAIREKLKNKADAPPLYIPPLPTIGKPKYEEMIGDIVLDDDFYSCFIDLTNKSNVKDEKGRRRRKGVRRHDALTRICWHQTAFTWKPYRVLAAARKWSGHHQINAHACFDTDGTILLIHNFFYYLWTANSYNTSCLSFEVMGNFEGVLGSGKWYKADKFGRARPGRIQMVRARQMTQWLLDPERGPGDDKLPQPLLEWRTACRKHGNPLKWNNAHRESTDDRGGDCGSELWYHVAFWGIENTKLEHGPKMGNGMDIQDDWWSRPIAAPLP